MNELEFGYPKSCETCREFSNVPLELRVKPFFQKGTSPHRLMIIGQDPTIRRKAERVKHVLMLDQLTSPLSQWLRKLIGEDYYETATIYATNLVKCSFGTQPSSSERVAKSF